MGVEEKTSGSSRLHYEELSREAKKAVAVILTLVEISLYLVFQKRWREVKPRLVSGKITVWA